MKESLHTPWSDTCSLIRIETVKDAQGYETETETAFPIACTWEDGTSQSEFYRSYKAGMQASNSVEIWKADMLRAWPRGTPGRRFVDFEGQRYKVLRNFPSGFDLQTLILSEVIR